MLWRGLPGGGWLGGVGARVGWGGVGGGGGGRGRRQEDHMSVLFACLPGVLQPCSHDTLGGGKPHPPHPVCHRREPKT